MVRWPVLGTQLSHVGLLPMEEAEVHFDAGAIKDVCGSFSSLLQVFLAVP